LSYAVPLSLPLSLFKALPPLNHVNMISLKMRRKREKKIICITERAITIDTGEATAYSICIIYMSY